MTKALPVSHLTGVFVIVLWVLQRHTHHAGRDNRGYRMFVNHLAHSIFQQHNKLIEGFNLALQFDAVYKINGNGNSFLT